MIWLTTSDLKRGTMRWHYQEDGNSIKEAWVMNGSETYVRKKLIYEDGA
jgi:hypothetical protein